MAGQIHDRPTRAMATDAEPVSARADLIGGLAWIALGVAIVAGSLAMDRYESVGATLHTMPGLVPGLLGMAISALGLLLAVRAIRARAIAGLAAPWRPDAEGRATLKRAALATALALLYTLGLVGRMWFPAATALFVFAFIMIFEISPGVQRSLARRATIAAITAITTAAVVSLVFERIFLVRLP
jgi:hypothetical protein